MLRVDHNNQPPRNAYNCAFVKVCKLAGRSGGQRRFGGQEPKVAFFPGDGVPTSGVYRVEHDSHRLMHEATLLADTLFPRCKRCKGAVRFRLIRSVLDSQVIPFRANSLLEEYTEPKAPQSAVG